MRHKLSITLGLSLLVLGSAPMFSQGLKHPDKGRDLVKASPAPTSLKEESKKVNTPEGASVFQTHPVTVYLKPTPLAANAGLENASATATLLIRQGSVTILVDLNGAELPAGSVLEGWVVDPGTEGGPGGAGLSSVSNADEVYGTPFGDPNIDNLVDEAAYALSTGVFKRQGHTDSYVNIFKIDNNLSPYNAVVVTIESDGNGQNYDPRPGTPILVGLF